ncbi:hypothetical protein Aph01nite_76350 [Acrocarpospora phusangensis]|uniref:Squalene cyclase C-terminal domain-containing protein n=1 Tax=Acrocarpospora phusangensis TaxID=1070424 RepID=A0A919QKV2_9ACTN|nr:prenyltransferase/squalene oxidase repeat-containing protein [Acrocarpospora phusangensis]GIH29325.1 hypothetical protein Aph01nite_76350 [Acrocarpospora phusangensis]
MITGSEIAAGLTMRPGGQVSPSVYETGRLVALAPWLTGHDRRIGFLAESQRGDGGWGGPEGYALVPTLSAVEALLAVITRGDRTADLPTVVRTARRGLEFLTGWLGGAKNTSLPDTPANELIIPFLIEQINLYAHALVEYELPTKPLYFPSGMDGALLDVIRARLASGADVPAKLHHTLEVMGAAAAVTPAAGGVVGASPAAAAAWLGDRGLLDPADPVRQQLEAVVDLHGGPVPVGFPITVFERGWVLAWLLRAGLAPDVPEGLIADLNAAIGPAGTPAGPGLPADADTTSVALYALALLGHSREPDSLWLFASGDHFCTWPGEQGASATVNAHVIDAFGHYATTHPTASPRYAAAIGHLTAWLCERQRVDGSWEDRWHASPYYATVSCVLALADFGGAAGREPVERAVRWTRQTQRVDGSWGHWRGTPEETAYAIQILLAGPDPRKDAARLARGVDYLRRAPREANQPLWHDKDLYLPYAIVDSVVLAARHRAEIFLGGASA